MFQVRQERKFERQMHGGRLRLFLRKQDHDKQRFNSSNTLDMPSILEVGSCGVIIAEFQYWIAGVALG